MKLFAPLFFAGMAAGLLAGCNTTQPQAVASAPAASSAGAGVTPSGFRLPEGAGCTGDVARWQAIQDNDLQTGHVTQAVHAAIKREIEAAASACAAGQSAQASAMVRASRARHGYPGG
ncbi:MAG: hypothetical protein JWN93_2680 [Hyphomicrobiales bacterium]|nr:hypothetical protein [Hyphomicrobiales bacterium]